MNLGRCSWTPPPMDRGIGSLPPSPPKENIENNCSCSSSRPRRWRNRSRGVPRSMETTQNRGGIKNETKRNKQTKNSETPMGERNVTNKRNKLRTWWRFPLPFVSPQKKPRKIYLPAENVPPCGGSHINEIQQMVKTNKREKRHGLSGISLGGGNFRGAKMAWSSHEKVVAGQRFRSWKEDRGPTFSGWYGILNGRGQNRNQVRRPAMLPVRDEKKTVEGAERGMGGGRTMGSLPEELPPPTTSKISATSFSVVKYLNHRKKIQHFTYLLNYFPETCIFF